MESTKIGDTARPVPRALSAPSERLPLAIVAPLVVVAVDCIVASLDSRCPPQRHFVWHIFVG
ncbi:hypothetical protein AGR5A_pa10020 [Agrobacterium genomosp. 5 str. CFBP 6626]|nr:hypothetical protein AGR5A_pa10020 [Agrobacterium genomosp. 5 str. CFBP 6626]